MEKRSRRPLIDDNGEARAPTAAEWKWVIRAVDFPDFEAASAFAEKRERFLRAAEEAGIARKTFLPFAPGKPGFIERAIAALDSAARAGRKSALAGRHAAE